jgi:hypothetical protein
MAVNIGGILKPETVNYVPKVYSYLGNNEAFDSSGKPTNALLDALKMTESGGNPRAVSSAGAMGAYQMMPKTASRFGVSNPFDPEQSRRGASEYLTFLYKRYKDPDLAIAAYNAGEGRIDGAIKTDKARGGTGEWSGGAGGGGGTSIGSMVVDGAKGLASSFAGGGVSSLANYWLIGIGTVLAIAALVISQQKNVVEVVGDVKNIAGKATGIGAMIV